VVLIGFEGSVFAQPARVFAKWVFLKQIDMQKVINKLEAELRVQKLTKLAEKERTKKMNDGCKVGEPHYYDEDYISQLELAIGVLKKDTGASTP
jgi:hypothetical protein